MHDKKYMFIAYAGANMSKYPPKYPLDASVTDKAKKPLFASRGIYLS